LFGAFDSLWVLVAIPAAVLCGIAHAAPVAAFTITLRSEIQLAAFYRFVVMPISLFSGVFFPVSQLPAGVEQVAYLTPLWHGVDLCRDLALGQASWGPSLGHVAYLALWMVAGFVLARRLYERRLQP
jgi:lipooligosaccharide transport system permease protein